MINKRIYYLIIGLLFFTLFACMNNSEKRSFKNVDTLKEKPKVITTKLNPETKEIDLQELEHILAKSVDYQNVSHKFLDEIGEIDTLFFTKSLISVLKVISIKKATSDFDSDIIKYNLTISNDLYSFSKENIFITGPYTFIAKSNELYFSVVKSDNSDSFNYYLDLYLIDFKSSDSHKIIKKDVKNTVNLIPSVYSKNNLLYLDGNSLAEIDLNTSKAKILLNFVDYGFRFIKIEEIGKNKLKLFYKKDISEAEVFYSIINW